MDALIRLAEAWWPLYAVHFAEVSLFILLVWAVDRWMTLDTRLRYVLYLLALAKVFVPPFYAIPLPEFLTVSGDVPIGVPIVPVYADVVVGNKVVAPVQVAPLPLAFYLFCLWGVSVVVWAGVTLWKNAAFHHALSLAVPVDLAREVESLDEARDVAVYAKASLRSPLLVGIVKPRLYLPSHWSSWSSEELRGVVAHELAHRNNRDIWVLIFQGIATALFCINPLIWLLNRRLTFLRELRCDEAVLRETNLTPAEYGRLLFGFVDRRPALSALYFNERGSALKERLKHVLNFKADKVKRSKSQLAIPILIGLAIVPFSIRDAYTLPSPIDLKEEPTPADAEADGREVMVLDEVEEKPAVWGEVIPTDDMELPEEAIGDHEVLTKENEREQKAKKVPDSPLKKEKVERVPKEQPSPPASVHAEQDTADSSSADADTGEVLDFDTVETEPKILHAVDPVYPEIAKNAGLNNKVILKFVVNVDGSVSDVSVLRGYNIFRQPAIDALSQWRFKPAEHKGKVVPVWMVQMIAFREPEAPSRTFAHVDTSGVLKKSEAEEKPHLIYLVPAEYLREMDKKKIESLWNVKLMVNIHSSKYPFFAIVVE